MGLRVGGCAAALAFTACGLSESDSEPAPARSTTCALDISLSGAASYEPATPDNLACASAVQTGPGMMLLFLPRESNAIKGVGISTTEALPGEVGAGMNTQLSATLADDSSAMAAGCQSELLENTLLASDATGASYLLRGTGSCTNQPPSSLLVNGNFAFTATTVWTK